MVQAAPYHRFGDADGPAIGTGHEISVRGGKLCAYFALDTRAAREFAGLLAEHPEVSWAWAELKPVEHVRSAGVEVVLHRRVRLDHAAVMLAAGDGAYRDEVRVVAHGGYPATWITGASTTTITTPARDGEAFTRTTDAHGWRMSAPTGSVDSVR